MRSVLIQVSDSTGRLRRACGNEQEHEMLITFMETTPPQEVGRTEVGQTRQNHTDETRMRIRGGDRNTFIQNTYNIVRPEEERKPIGKCELKNIGKFELDSLRLKSMAKGAVIGLAPGGAGGLINYAFTGDIWQLVGNLGANVLGNALMGLTRPTVHKLTYKIGSEKYAVGTTPQLIEHKGRRFNLTLFPDESYAYMVDQDDPSCFDLKVIPKNSNLFIGYGHWGSSGFELEKSGVSRQIPDVRTPIVGRPVSVPSRGLPDPRGSIIRDGSGLLIKPGVERVIPN